MPIPGPGPAISMTTIATEFGGTVPHSLNEYYRGGGLVPNTPTNAAIPTSGTIAMGNFYGSANRNIVNITIGGNVQNYDVFANRSPSYVAGSTDLIVTVNPGVVVGSASTGSFAMLVPSSFSPTDTVTIVNNGTIIGAGGPGGAGAPAGSGTPRGIAGSPGSSGGNGLSVSRPTIVTNNGTLAGGGGGGGGGAGQAFNPVPSRAAGGGGGGGAGSSVGSGGGGGTGVNSPGVPGNPGGAGTLTTGGGGGPGTTLPFGNRAGGAGGGQGGAGVAGSPNLSNFVPAAGGAGGAGGRYITGNPFVTYPATGTRLGNVG